MEELKVLLDTNIIIHRENNKLTNESIGLLYKWLDKLHYVKCIHQCSVEELHKCKNKEYVELLDVKIKSYDVLDKFDEPNSEFLFKLDNKFPIKNENDRIDNQLLYEVYRQKVSLFITEDTKIIEKAELLGIANKVVSIDDFILACQEKYPGLKEYKFNSVYQVKFGQIDVNDEFFNSLRNNYGGIKFNEWYVRKSDEKAYVHYNAFNELSGFLYIKIEEKDEQYTDIEPKFEPKKRLKIGTFKVVSTGYRLGERFLQIIFDNAINRDVDEIYVTMYDNTDELQKLKETFTNWGFEEYGLKNGKELVLVKKMKEYNRIKTIKQNFPNIDYCVKKLFLPIEPQYHTRLFPDSMLFTERKLEFENYLGFRYALEKCYISFSYKKNFNKGDIVLIYRKGLVNEQKSYKSVISSVCIIEEVYRDIKSKDEMIKICKNRSVFNINELNRIWESGKDKIQILKLIYIASFEKKIILKRLWDMGIVQFPGGPRPFDEISDSQFDMIIKESTTKIYGYKNNIIKGN